MKPKSDQQSKLPENQPAIQGIVFGLIAAVTYGVFAMFFVGQRPYFHDEASTWFFASAGLGNLFDSLGSDVHPPFYFLISWLILQSGQLMALRFFSVLCTAVAIGLLSWRMSERFGRSGQFMSLFLASSPFLIFVGCFARYYGLVLLEFVVLILVAESLLRGNSHRSSSWKLGVIAACILMTNYAAAFLILPPVFLGLLVFLKREKKLRLFWESLVPCIVIFAVWSPWFLTQIGDGFDGRAEGFALSEFINNFIRNTGYLGYSFFASDGLPPWNRVGWLAAVLGVLVSLYAVIVGLKESQTRVQALVLIGWLIGVCMFGGLVMPGASFIFFPVRVAWSFFLWVFLILIVIHNRPNMQTKMIWVMCFMNGLGLQGLIWQNNSTNWAYTIPHHDIANVIESELLEHPNTNVYIDTSSFIQVRYELELRDIDFILNDCSPDDATAILVLSTASSSPWPLIEAVGLPKECNPEGSWELVREELFVPENQSSITLKEKIMGRSVAPYKLSLRKYERSSN